MIEEQQDRAFGYAYCQNEEYRRDKELELDMLQVVIAQKTFFLP